jgi:uncharacterized membrane protein
VAHREALLLAGIVLLGIAIRFPTLSEQSFWYDEAVTHGIVSGGLAHVISTVPKTESTPPLYYVLLWLWSRLFGTHEIGLRSLSALCGTFTIPVLWLLGRRIASSRAGLIAALLCAVNPLLFWYSQEARAYALLVLMSSVSLLVLVWALEAPTERRMIVWGLTAAVTLATHYFAIFLLIAEAVWLAIALRKGRSLSVARIASALAPVVIVGAALAPLAIHQNNGRATFIATQSGSLPVRLAQLVKQDLVAFDEPVKVLTSILALVFVLAAVISLARRGCHYDQRAGFLMGAVGVGAIALAVLVALISTDYIDTRNLLASWPALLMMVASGFAVRRAGPITQLACLGLVVVSLVSVVAVMTDPLFQRADWRGVARVMGTPTVARAILGDHQADTSLAPYMSGLSPFPRVAAVEEVDVFKLDYRSHGAHHLSSPPRGNPAPALRGFVLVERRHTSSYTVLRYRAAVPVPENSPKLLPLRLIPHDEYSLLLQTPAGAGSDR